MNDIHYLNQVPLNAIAVDTNSVIIQREVFDRLDDYTRSHPTGPRPGRIFKKNLHWSGSPPNWFVYICWGDGDTGGVWNRGRPALILDDKDD